MVIGIGTDIIEIERVEKACRRETFFTRCFSIREQELIGENFTKAAGNFAVKEAVSKVFGTGFRGFELCDIEVLRDGLGKPYVNLYNGAEYLANQLGIRHIHVSISNTNIYAAAFAVGEGE